MSDETGEHVHTPRSNGDGTWHCTNCGNEYYDGEDGSEED